MNIQNQGKIQYSHMNEDGMLHNKNEDCSINYVPVDEQTESSPRGGGPLQGLDEPLAKIGK